MKRSTAYVVQRFWFYSLFMILISVAIGPQSAYAASPGINAIWAENRPIIDGFATNAEWEGTPYHKFAHGYIHFQNDSNYLYILVDAIDDTVFDDPKYYPDRFIDYAAVEFDANQDNSVTLYQDPRFGWYPDERIYKKCYPLGIVDSGPYTGMYYVSRGYNIASVMRHGFYPSFNSIKAHMIWEFAIDLREINASPGKTVRAGITVASTTPNFHDNIPVDFSKSYATLLEITLAKKPSCTVMDVPMYYQGYPSTLDDKPGKASWENDPYGLYLNNDTINTMGLWGCNTTSHAMALQYYFSRINNLNVSTNPGILNTWLRTNAGYTKGPIGEKVAEYARSMSGGKLNLDITGYLPPNNDKLKEHLCGGNLAILGVKGDDHWVLATGVTQVDGQETFMIQDPIWGIGQTTLAQEYNDAYYFIRYLTAEYTNVSRLSFTAHSPVHLVVTDPLGRKAGYDPRTSTTYDDIPEVAYADVTIESIFGETLPSEKTLSISLPLDGDYTLEVIGYDTGPYSIDILSTKPYGDTVTSTFTGMAQAGSVETQVITFDPLAEIFLPLVMR